MPHCRPMMKQSDQITTVDPTISTPAWRSASPKNLKTRRRKISPNTRAKNFVMSPKEASQSRGTASQPDMPLQSAVGSGRWAEQSLDHRDLRMRGQECLREDVVEREHAQERDHDGLVDRSAHPFGAAGRSHPLVAA